MKEIIQIEAKHENLILLGDLNRHISNSVVKENHPKLSVAGKLLLEFLENDKYVLVNATDKTTGGVFTRYDKSDPNDDAKKSLLDMVIVSKDLLKYIEKLEVDKSLQWTPYRVVKGEYKFPDHYALLLVLKSIPMRQQNFVSNQKQIIWNTKKKMGWEIYKDMTENNDEFHKASSLKSSPDNILKVVEKESSKVKHICFGKVKLSSKSKKDKNLEELHRQKMDANKIVDTIEKEKKVQKVDAKIVDVMMDIQKDKYEKEVNNLKEVKRAKGKSAAIFKLRDKILGTKKSPQEQVVIKDPTTQAYVYTPEEIKEATLKYCVNLLTKGEPKAEYKDIVEQKKTLHFERMKETIENDYDTLPAELFYKVLESLARKPGNKYQFIVKSGYSYKRALLNLFQIIWETEHIPEAWYDSTLIQISKGKSNISDLDSFRFIHDKNSVFKFFGQIVMTLAKVPIFKNMSKFQIACKPGHRASEHLYTIKSVIAHFTSRKKGLLMSSFDLEKFFDSEELFDCLGELHSRDVKGKLYRLIYQMNKNIRIKVKTPVGETKSKDTGPAVGQGTVDGAILSSNNTDKGLEVAFDDPSKEIEIEETVLGPISFMDDIFRMAENRDNAQYANNKMEEFIGPKLLKINFLKSGYLIVGNRKARKSLENQVKNKPLELCGQKMIEVKVIKFLGDYISFELQDSVYKTVLKRMGLARQAMYEIRAVVEDTRASHLGGINVALSLWEGAVVPMLLYNADTWGIISNKTWKLLNSVFNDFYRCLFRIGSGCPIVGFYWHCGDLFVENRILQMKLNFLYHLENLEDGALAKEIYKIEVKKAVGIVEELKDHLAKMNVESTRGYTKWKWKILVKKYVNQKNREEIIQKAKGYKKVSHEKYSTEQFERKEYFYKLNLESVRTKFRVENEMVATIRKNFTSKYRNSTLSCPSCVNVDPSSMWNGDNTNSYSNNTTSEQQNKSNNNNPNYMRPADTQFHVLHECVAFEDLREKYDTKEDTQLVEFFKEVVKRRVKNGED